MVTAVAWPPNFKWAVENSETGTIIMVLVALEEVDASSVTMATWKQFYSGLVTV